MISFNPADLKSIKVLIRHFFSLLPGGEAGSINTVKALPGELDLNYFIETEKGEKFTLKIAQFGESEEALDMQNQAMLYLQQQRTPAKNGTKIIELPQVVSNKGGEIISKVLDEQGRERYLRLITWIDGKVLSRVNPHHDELLQSLGEGVAHLTKHLFDFDHPSVHREYKWNNSKPEWTKEYFHLISTEKRKTIANYFLDLFRTKAKILFPHLRESAIHNDANDYNVLVSLDGNKVSGVIDFGDMLYTHSINDLAITIAYAVMKKVDPIQAACEVIKGYNKVFPLTEKEVEALFPMIGCRLLISVTVAAINRRDHPENEYLFVSEKNAWEVLEKFHQLSPALVHIQFREACGLEPCPAALPYKNWIKDNPIASRKIVNHDFQNQSYASLDLSVGSTDLGNNNNFETIDTFNHKISSLLAQRKEQVGLGGYLETRPFYTTDAYSVMGNEGPQWRTVHLGVDVWMVAETKVYAPIEGEIFAVKDNKGERNYGPTLIIQHIINEELTFYTLYGHLSWESIKHWTIGDSVSANDQIATIGAPPENGNWPPHLHFQVMLDMLNYKDDFPGVAFPNQKEIWASICPNPMELLGMKLKCKSQKYTSEEILEKRKKTLGKSLSISYQKPLTMVRGFGPYLYDTTGRRYLDTVNNVAHVGHEHPKVVRAAQNQMALLNTNTRYLHPAIVEFAEALLKTLPEELCVCHFVNSGSEANELALRMAKTFSNQKDMLVVDVGYHGNTNACIEISPYKFNSKGGAGKADHIHIMPMPDTYRGIYRSDDPNAGEKYANHLQTTIEKLQSKGKGIAGFICESILSCGGQIPLPKGYLKKAFEYVRAAGGVCIADEVQVGFGRVGSHFWGFELQNVVPDIVVMGKPIGNGHPLGAVVCTRAVADAFTNGMEYFNTFGGNPVSSTIGKTVLEVIQEEELQQNALKIGNLLTNGLRELQKQHSIIGDIRGHGLFLGIELVKNKEDLTPAEKETTYLANRMKAHGILMSTDGPYHNVLKIKPPMCFNEKNATFLLETLDKVLKEDFMKQWD